MGGGGINVRHQETADQSVEVLLQDRHIRLMDVQKVRRRNIRGLASFKCWLNRHTYATRLVWYLLLGSVRDCISVNRHPNRQIVRVFNYADIQLHYERIYEQSIGLKCISGVFAFWIRTIRIQHRVEAPHYRYLVVTPERGCYAC